MRDEVEAKVDAARIGIDRRVVERALQSVPDDMPDLTVSGWRYSRDSPNDPFPLDAEGWYVSLAAALAWIDEVEEMGGRIKTPNRNSYGAKHDVERWAEGVYVANGTMILAALIRGVPYHYGDFDGPNCTLALSKRGRKAVDRSVGVRR